MSSPMCAVFRRSPITQSWLGGLLRRGSAAEVELLSPVELMRLLIVSRSRCPAHELDFRKILFNPSFVLALDRVLHLLQQIVVIDFCCVVVLDVAVFFIGETTAQPPG